MKKLRYLAPAILLLFPFVFVAIFAPLLPLPDPQAPDLFHRHKPPSASHWFGTDADGLDVFSRVLYATRIDFGIALGAVLAGILIGAPMGAIAAYRGGVLENLIERGNEIMQAFPLILFAMIVSLIVGKGMVTLMVVLAIYNAPFYSKIVRGIVKPLIDTDFVHAAKCAGQRPVSIVVKHLLPNAFPGIASQFPLSAAAAVRTIATLSFIGLGVSPPTPEWGAMISTGASHIIFGEWWSSILPGLALLFSVLGLNNLGERMRNLLERGV